MTTRETGVEEFWRNLSQRQRQAVLEILLSEIEETYQSLDDKSKMRLAGPIFELIEILERLRRVPTDAERLSTLKAIELGCRKVGVHQVERSNRWPSFREGLACLGEASADRMAPAGLAPE